MSEQHPDSRGFELVADLYEHSRPGYPADALRWFTESLELRAGRTVLDLGAGTGKLTRDLLATGARVIAIEPGDQMRARLESAVPGAEVHAGVAEAIPVPDGEVDAVTAGQAFHWFRFDEALLEVHRVLRPGGGLALIWNERDPEDDLQREISTLLRPFVPPGRARVTEVGWREAVEESRFFGPLEERRYRFVEELDAELLRERIATISFVASALESERAWLDRELRELAETRGGRVCFAYLTQAFVVRATPS